jgi:hypothetical protein
VIVPVRLGECLGRIEDRHGAGLVTVAAFVLALPGTERFGRIGDLGDRLKQGRLVALDLNDQGDGGLFGDLEVFF